MKIPGVALALAVVLVAPFADGAGKSAEASIVSVTKDTIVIRNGSNPGYKVKVQESNGLQKTMPDANIDTYSVKPWTPVTVNGLPAKLTDLKPGMKVRVGQGLDRSIAHSIAASNVPPPQKADATDKSPPPKGKGPRKLSQGIDAYKVMAVTADTLTVGQDGGKKSTAYRLGKFTEISVNGKASPFSAVKVGMEVTLKTSADPKIAASILARDAD
jgi:hypothetical protein